MELLYPGAYLFITNLFIINLTSNPSGVFKRFTRDSYIKVIVFKVENMLGSGRDNIWFWLQELNIVRSHGCHKCYIFAPMCDNIVLG